jgi:hypothetical protein
MTTTAGCQVTNNRWPWAGDYRYDTQSGRGQPHSKTQAITVVQTASEGFGLRLSSAALDLSPTTLPITIDPTQHDWPANPRFIVLPISPSPDQLLLYSLSRNRCILILALCLI